MGRQESFDVREDEEPIIMENELFAVVGGSRFYQYGKDFIWIDCIAGIREYDYVYFFEDISIRHAFEDAERNPQAALDAERLMRIRLNRAYNSDMQIGDRIALPAEYEEYARKLEQNEAGQEGRLPLVRQHWQNHENAPPSVLGDGGAFISAMERSFPYSHSMRRSVHCV